MKFYKIVWLIFICLTTACNSAIEATDSAAGTTANAKPSVAPPIPARASDGLILLYEFTQGTLTNTVYDSSGFGTPQDMFARDVNSVTWLNPGLSIDKPVEIVTGDGASGTISRPTQIKSAVIASDAFTWETWLKPANLTQTGATGYPAAVIFSYAYYATTQNFMVGQSGGEYTIHLTTDLSNNDVTTQSSTVTTSRTHLVVTWSSASAELRLYINGNLSNTWPLSGTTNKAWTDLPIRVSHEIDPNSPNMTNNWLGDIYLIAMYDRVLSDAEILNNYYAGSQ